MISVLDLATELGISTGSLKTAIKKVSDWLEIKGVSHKQLKVKKEAQRIKNNKAIADIYPLSDELVEIIKTEFKEKDDYISVNELSRTNNISKNEFHQFIRAEKESNLSDFLGMNIFLNKRQTYIPLLIRAEVLKRFFIFLLSKSSNKSNRGVLFNKSTEEKEEFNILEEIAVDSTKRGRILGFHRNRNKENAAIVGFYDGSMKFETEVRRIFTGNRILNFQEYDSHSEQPVVFKFKLSEILSKKNREKINLLVYGLQSTPVQVFGGGRPCYQPLFH